jgi:hypothetical protein
MRSILVSVLACLASAATACGGGGSSADGVIFEGTLTQTGLGHSSAATVATKHAPGVRIENVKICILGECSLTDSIGQWGLQVPDFGDGDVAITVNGHGIDSAVSVDIPASAKEVTIALGRDSNTITVTRLIIDGEDHSGHDHDHK